MVKLALYKGKGLIGNKLIRVWTRSPYSHCELVVDGKSYSSSLMDKGVRCKDILFTSDHWDFIDLPDSLGQRILAYYETTKSEKYAWRDLILSQVFNGNSDQPGAAFCSDWCAAAIGLPNPSIYSPRTLGELARWLYPTSILP